MIVTVYHEAAEPVSRWFDALSEGIEWVAKFDRSLESSLAQAWTNRQYGRMSLATVAQSGYTVTCREG